MSDFKAKMHQIRFPLKLRPNPVGRAYSAPQTPELYLRGASSKGREGRLEEKSEEGKGRGRER